jgi:autotransporter-associated beta strand protein
LLNVFGTVATSTTSDLNLRGRSTLNLESGANWTQGGTIVIQPLATFTSATMNVKTGSNFTYNGSSNITLARATSGGSGDATLNLSGGTFTTTQGFSNTAAGTGSGTTNLNFSSGGTIKISNDIAALITQGGSAFNVSMGTGGGIIDTNGFNTAIGVEVSGAGGLTKAGAGTLTLTGANSYAGTTAVTEGTLQIGDGGTSGTFGTGVVNVDGSSTLLLNRTDGGSMSADLNFGLTSGSNTMRVVAGTWDINGGTTNLDVRNTATWTVDAGATLNINQNTTAGNNVGFSGTTPTPTLILDGAGTGVMNRLIASGGAAGDVVKNGTGTWTFNAAYSGSDGWKTGGLTINDGVLAAGADNVLPWGTDRGNVTVNTPGVLDLTAGSVNVNGLAGDGTVRITGATDRTLTLGNADTTADFSGALQNTGAGVLALTKVGTGTQTLSGTNTHTGATTVSAGTLALGASGSIANTPTLSVETGATLDVSAVTGGWTLGVGQTLQGTGTVSGAVTASGTVAPGANGIGTLTAGSSNVTWNAGNAWTFDLSEVDTTSDTLAITGNFTKGSGSGWSFDFMGAQPIWGTEFTLVTFAGTDFDVADFDAATTRATLGAGSYSTSYFTLTGSSLTFTAVPEPTSALAGILLGAGLLRRRRRGA